MLTLNDFVELVKEECWSLGNAYTAQECDQAMHFAEKHLEISEV